MMVGEASPSSGLPCGRSRPTPSHLGGKLETNHWSDALHARIVQKSPAMRAAMNAVSARIVSRAFIQLYAAMRTIRRTAQATLFPMTTAFELFASATGTIGAARWHQPLAAARANQPQPPQQQNHGQQP